MADVWWHALGADLGTQEFELRKAVHAAAGPRRPVTIIIKNNCPGYNLSVISFVQEVAFYKHCHTHSC